MRHDLRWQSKCMCCGDIDWQPLRACTRPGSRVCAMSVPTQRRMTCLVASRRQRVRRRGTRAMHRHAHSLRRWLGRHRKLRGNAARRSHVGRIGLLLHLLLGNLHLAPTPILLRGHLLPCRMLPILLLQSWLR